MNAKVWCYTKKSLPSLSDLSGIKLLISFILERQFLPANEKMCKILTTVAQLIILL